MAGSAVTLQQRRVTDTLSCFQEASVKKIVLAIAVGQRTDRGDQAGAPGKAGRQERRAQDREGCADEG